MTSEFNAYLKEQQEEINTNIAAGILRCDFCGVFQVTHRLPTQDYKEKQTLPDGRILYVNHTEGYWASCDTCAPFLTPFNLDGLLIHLANTMPVFLDAKLREPLSISIYIVTELTKQLRGSYRQLQEYITGPVERIS